jgi:hypothetical protein
MSIVLWHDVGVFPTRGRPGYSFLIRTNREPLPHWSLGSYSSAPRAYMAGVRYVYGPIPRDLRPFVPETRGLEGLFTGINFPFVETS